MRPRRAFRQRLPLRKAAGGEDRIARQPARATGPCGGDIGRVQERLNLPQDAAAFDGWRWRKQPRCGIAASHGGSKQASAAMHDAAFGHGLHRAMACDFIIAANGARESFVRARIDGDRVMPIGNQDSGVQGALATADLLLRRPPGDPPRPAGAPIAALDF